METKDVASQVANFIEQSGLKEKLKDPEAQNNIYNMMKEKGVNIDRSLFDTMVKALTSDDASLSVDKLLKMGMESGLLGDGMKNLTGLFGK